MKKNKIVTAFLCFSVIALLPLVASAQTDIAARIKILQTQIGELKASLISQLQAGVPVNKPQPSAPKVNMPKISSPLLVAPPVNSPQDNFAPVDFQINVPGSIYKKIDTSKLEAIRDRFSQDEVVVKYKNGSKPFEVLKVAPGKVIDEIARLQNDPNIDYAEPNYLTHSLMTPNDPIYPYQWDLRDPATGGIDMAKAWDITAGSGSVIVALLDSGIAYENYGSFCKAPDLAGTAFVAGYNFIDNTTHVNDNYGHGTHVAGTIAQTTNNNLGTAGIAFKTALMPVKISDSAGNGTYTSMINGLNWAVDHGAKVVNLSLGGTGASNAMLTAVTNAYNKGVTIVASCGNSNAGSCEYPAAYNNYVLSVGASQYDRTKAPYSNYGPNLDVVAPGGSATDFNGDGIEERVYQNTFANGAYCTFDYYGKQGTSMAAPHVAGIAALLIAKGIATAPADIENIIKGTALDLGASGRDDTYGYGLVNAYRALSWGAASSCTTDSNCNDGLYCTGKEKCISGKCVAGTSVNCTSLNDACNVGACSETGKSCVKQANPEGFSCSDGNACNGAETCKAGVCTKGMALADGISCADSLYCNGTETCKAGVCLGTAINCDDNNACTVDTCNENIDRCVNTTAATGTKCSIGASSGICCYDVCKTGVTTCPVMTKCWSASPYPFLYYDSASYASRVKKFCKCAMGTYNLARYATSSVHSTPAQWGSYYVDSGDNTNWEAKTIQTTGNRIMSVQCGGTGTQIYYTDKDYYWPKP